MKDPWVAEHLTLTDVMSHRIGMETFQGDFMYWESDLNSDQVIQKFGMLTPIYDFRTKWGYCNAGFLIAGKCLEKITGMTWDQYIRVNIINPLEMKRTLVLTADVDKAENICAAHTLVGGKLQVIPRCHFVTSVTLVPEEKLGVVVLTNTDVNGFYEGLKWEIVDAYLGLPYRNYSQFFLSYFKPNMEKDMEINAAWQDSVKMKLPPPVKLSKFEGKYTHPVYGNAKLESLGDYLLLTLEHHPDLTGKLEYIGNNRFLCTYSSPLWGIKVFPFVIDDGKVKSFTLSVADFLEFTTYEFMKD